MARVQRAVTDLSERRACRTLGQPRATQRHKGTKTDTDKPLVARMHELAREHPRYGYRRIHAMLKRSGHKAGRDRVQRLCRRHGLRVPQKTHKRRIDSLLKHAGGEVRDFSSMGDMLKSELGAIEQGLGLVAELLKIQGTAVSAEKGR